MRDLEHHLQLTFEQAVRGTTLDIAIQDPGKTGGSEKLTIRIPPGVNEGQRIRLRGKGGRSSDGTAAGDLYIVCHVQPHPVFGREGNDLYLDVPLTIAEATLGAKVEIPTMDKRASITVPPGTPSGGSSRAPARNFGNAAG